MVPLVPTCDISMPPSPHIPYHRPLPPQATAVVGTQLGSAEPLFTLLLRGEARYTRGGRFALWETMAFFLRYCHLECQGSLSGRSLVLLGVEEVVALRHGAARQKKQLLPVFGWQHLRSWW